MGPGRKPRRPVFSEQGSYTLFICSSDRFTLTVEIWKGVGRPNIGRITVSYFLSEKKYQFMQLLTYVEVDMKCYNCINTSVTPY